MKSGVFFGVRCLFVCLLTAFVVVSFVHHVYSDGTPTAKDEVVIEPAGKEEPKADAAKAEEAPAVIVEPAIGPTAAPADEGDFNQNHLAKMLCRVLALEDRLPAAASVDDYFNLLTIVGIAPMDGWEVDSPVTRDDLAVVMVQALGLQGEVEDTLDPQCYIDALKSEGVDLDKGMFNVEHGLSFPSVVNSFNALKFGDTVSDNFCTSLSPIHTSTGY
ncbi:MAG TPA: hypothetical protein P5287_00150 [bacterium]|nr:hypothetical protein [bacterium]